MRARISEYVGTWAAKKDTQAWYSHAVRQVCTATSATRADAVCRAELGEMGRAGLRGECVREHERRSGAERHVLVLPYLFVAHTLRTVRCARCMVHVGVRA